MGNIIFLVLATIEIFLTVWAFIEQDNHVTEKNIIRITEFILLAVFLMTGILEWGFRYYIIALVLFVQALTGIIKLIRKNDKESSFRIGRTIGSSVGRIFGYYMALLAAIIFPQFKAIEPDGELAVAYHKYTWTDESRVETFAQVTEGETVPNRKLTVEFWYPDEETQRTQETQGTQETQRTQETQETQETQASRETYPLVVFSHGANGFSEGNLSTFQQLASHGYVVASIGHTYHSLYTLDTEQTLTTIDMGFQNEVISLAALEDSEQKYHITQGWLQLRTDDENFVLDTILRLTVEAEETPFTQIDTGKIGLFGHSLGGASSAALGRTRSDIGAVIDIDGSMLSEVVDFQDGREILTEEPYPVPLLNLYAQDHYEAARKDVEENPGIAYYNFQAAENAVEAYDVILLKAGHLNFTDLPLFSPLFAKILGIGTVDARYGIETMNQVVLQFFDSVLKQDIKPDLKMEY